MASENSSFYGYSNPVPDVAPPAVPAPPNPATGVSDNSSFYGTQNPTPDEMESVNDLVDDAIAAATSALASASAAAGSANDSATSAANSNGFAAASAASATNSANSATAAAGSASAASTSATNAGNSATAANTSATNAATSATNSANSATASQNSATASSNSATASQNSATASANSATASQNSANASAASAATFTPYGSNPAMNGTASPGTSANYSRGDHVHPTDTSRAPLASPTFTGSPAAPTAVSTDNTTALATTAYVKSLLATTAPLVNGTAAVGTSILMARQDHVHPTDTSRAAVNSPVFTGIPQAPTPATSDNSTTIATTAFVKAQGGSGLTGFRNRIINGDMRIDQRNAGAAQTITAASALAYTVDRFYAYSSGANVTGQRIAGAGNTQFIYRFTGAASVTAIGFAQRIETANSIDLAGNTVTLSVDLANSLLTTVTWAAYYANTADTFGTLGSPTKTLISSGTFTVSSTLTRYNTQITVPAAATTGIEIVVSVGGQTSGTWQIGNMQLELGSASTQFEKRLSAVEETLVRRYYELGRVYMRANASNLIGSHLQYSTTKRITNPQVVFSSTAYGNASAITASDIDPTGFTTTATVTTANTDTIVNSAWSSLAEL